MVDCPRETSDWVAGIAAQEEQEREPIVRLVGAPEPPRPRRQVFAKQLDRIMRVSPLAGVVLLVGNTGLAMATFLEWRGGHPAIWAAVSALVVGLLVVVAANLWAGRLDMIRAMRASGAFHDPTQVYQFTPWERIIWRNAMLPQMRHQASLGRSTGAPGTEDLEEQIQRLEAWEALGYIPKAEYPEDLVQYYYGKGGRL